MNIIQTFNEVEILYFCIENRGKGYLTSCLPGGPYCVHISPAIHSLVEQKNIVCFYLMMKSTYFCIYT